MLIDKVGLDSDAFKKSFLEGKLSIDCLEIKLTQKGVTEPRVYLSPGFMLANPETGVEARLVFKRDPGSAYDPFGGIKEALSVSSGELLPESHFYRLEATDVAGNVWTNSAVFLKVDSMASSEVVSFACDHIQAELPLQQSTEFAHFLFVDDLDFPLNMSTISKGLVRGDERTTFERTHSSGIVSGMQASYFKSSGGEGAPVFEFFSKTLGEQPAPTDFDERLLEAIRFCSAAMVSPVMSEVSRAGKRVVRLSKAKSLNNGVVSPPLSDSNAPQDFYRLMGCYYDYACQNAVGRNGAPLSVKLGGLFTLKGVWLDTIALLLCVATESVLDIPLFKSLGKPNTSLLGLIKELFDWVKKAPVEQSLRERALSAMGSMKSNRAVDKMYALSKVGAIDEEEIKSWKFLRNPSAHGTFEIDEDKFQELLDHVHRVIALIYKLTFLTIGYAGKYSDYGHHGWRSRDYDAPSILKSLEGSAIQVPPSTAK